MISGRFHTLARDKEIVRLGSGTDMKYIHEEAMARGLSVLKRFSNFAQTCGAPVRAIATSAVREALNKEEFLRRARIETGINIEIASGTEEARLIHLGVLQALPVIRKRILLLDIGGGSTEILVATGRRIFYSNSIKLGAVRLMQRFFPIGNAQSKGDFRMPEVCSGNVGTNCSRHQIPSIRHRYRHFGNHNEFGQHHSTPEIKNQGCSTERRPNNSQGSLYVSEEILRRPTSADRMRISGLDPKRADIIPAGAILASSLFREFHLQKLTISDFGLREGVLFDSIEKLHPKKSSDPLHDLRYKSSIHLAESCRYEKKHSHQVTRLALSLFQQTQRLHHLGEEEREFLEQAALLHEIGLFISHTSHHQHSYYLIRNAELAGFTENEKAIIANVARYHRKSLPKLKHEGFRILSAKDQDIVSKLASLLRIADGLDRSHKSAVDHLKVRIIGRHMHITAFCKQKHDPTMEQWGAERNQELFEKTFNMQGSSKHPSHPLIRNALRIITRSAAKGFRCQ